VINWFRDVLGRRVFCVRRYSRNFYKFLSSYYRLLNNIGAKYVYKCVRGTCYSYIEVGSDITSALLEAPGLVIESARSIRECTDGVLLPPPPADVGFLDMGLPKYEKEDYLVLGLVGSKKLPIGLDDVWRHIWILGSTGSGKTHTAARLARCLASLGQGVLVLDWHGEYASLLDRYNTRLRILSYPSMPRLPLVNSDMPLEVSLDILERVLSLSPFQSSILSLILALVSGVLSPSELRETEKALGSTVFNAISRAFESKSLGKDSGLRDLYLLLLEAYEEASSNWITRSEKEIWAALLRRIQIFITSGYEDLFSVFGNFPQLFSSPDGVTVVDLSSIHSLRARRLYAYFLLYGVYFSRIKHYSGSGLVVIVEEAHNLLDLDIVPTILQEARKYRLGLIIITHAPSTLPIAAQANLNTLIIHRIVGEKDREFLSHIIGSRELGETVSSLKPGEAIVLTSQGAPVIASISLDASCT